MTNLPDSYYQRLTGNNPNPLSKEALDDVHARFLALGIDLTRVTSNPVLLPIPDDFGTIESEIDDAIDVLAEPLDLVEDLVDVDLSTIVKPSNWTMATGWNVWNKGKWQPMPKPPASRAMILDTETVLVGSEWFPTCCIAVTSKGVACWLTNFDDMPRTIPFGEGNVVVGHNIAYDRRYLSSEYHLQVPKNKFIDTMSIWIVCNGMSNQQSLAYMASKASESLFNPGWGDETATAGLDAVYEQLFNQKLDKGVRDLIAPGNGKKSGLSWVSQNMASVMSYCYDDVIATLRVFQVLHPRWKLKRPHPVSRIAHTLLSGCKLPLSVDRFPGFYDRVESYMDAIRTDISDKLMAWGEKFYLDNPECDPDNLQLLSLDWTRTHKGTSAPKWLKDMRLAYKKQTLSISQRNSVIVLGIKYLGELVFWDTAIEGWATSKGGLPHPDGGNKRVTDVFIKDYINLYESGAMSGDSEEVKELLRLKTSLVNWVSLRKRVADIKVEPTPEGVPMDLTGIVPSGTVTGRCKDNLWLVCPNPKKDRVGTELKSMVEAPTGYVFVGADIASEESWLAGIMGDSQYGFNASSPLGYINVNGVKENGTDLHTMMAAKASVSRDVAKTINYGMLYGQGVKGASNTLQHANPGSTDSEATAKRFIEGFKGAGNPKRGISYSGGIASEAFNKMHELTSVRQPKTPLLNAWMSSTLAMDEQAGTSKLNWIVQASGSDFRDLLICLVQSFSRKLGIEMVLLIMIHDEARYMVKIGDEVRAAYVLQLAHLYCRAAFIDAMGLDNIPANIAWFPDVDVDTVLRKDPAAPQITPTQTEPIPAGQCWSPSQLLSKINK